MDEYYLSKKDWDTMVVGDRRGDIVFKKIAPAIKMVFTRK
jgi:hypothetical protein